MAAPACTDIHKKWAVSSQPDFGLQPKLQIFAWTRERNLPCAAAFFRANGRGHRPPRGTLHLSAACCCRGRQSLGRCCRSSQCLEPFHAKSDSEREPIPGATLSQIASESQASHRVIHAGREHDRRACAACPRSLRVGRPWLDDRDAQSLCQRTHATPHARKAKKTRFDGILDILVRRRHVASSRIVAGGSMHSLASAGGRPGCNITRMRSFSPLSECSRGRGC